jgi:hypothetical protein
MGLPCPNLFTGGHNFHGKHEFIPLQSMESGRHPGGAGAPHLCLAGYSKDGARPVIKPSPNRHERHAGRQGAKFSGALPMFDVDTLLGQHLPRLASQLCLRPLLRQGLRWLLHERPSPALPRAIPTCADSTSSSRPSPSSTSTTG